MRNYDEIAADLSNPLDSKLIAIRPRDKRRYLEGWNAINQANRIFGYDGWGTEVLNVDFKEISRLDRETGEVVQIGLYAATVRVTVTGWAPKTDIGVGLTAGASPDAHETAYKGAVTDGLKRALRQFGPQFGNELYDHDAPTVAESQPQQRQPAGAGAPTGAPSGQRPAQSSPNNSSQATPAQVNALYAIGRREFHWAEEEMDAHCRAVFGKAPGDLTKTEASQLIDRMKTNPSSLG